MVENIIEIIDRIKKLKGLRDDDEVAVALGMTKGNLSSYKTRQAIPYEYLSKFCRQESVSFDWLLTGEGEMYRKVSETIAEEVPPYGLSKEAEVLIREISEHLARLNFKFLSTDVWMARVLEELIDMLLNKGIIQLTDLPPIVWEKIKLRKNLRDHEMPGKK